MNSASARELGLAHSGGTKRNTNEPIGRFDLEPDRARRSAFETASIAASCPTTRSWSRSSMWISFSTSPSSRRSVGIRPLGDDGGDVVLVDLLLDHRGRLRLLALELAFELGQEPVADLGDASQLAVPLGALGLHAQLVDLPRDLLDAVEQVLLAGPAGAQLVPSCLRLGEPSRSSGSRVAGDSFAIAASSISSCVTRRSASSSSTGDESISMRSATRTRRRGRSPCPAGNGRRCSGRRAPPRQRAPRRGSEPWCAS